MSKNIFDKIINFYQIILDPTFSTRKNTLITTYQSFKIAFEKGCSQYSFKNRGETYYFDIRNFDEKGLFGLYSKEENFIDPLVRFRNEDTLEVHPFKLPPNNVLEHYTFFYADFENNIMSIIYNQKAARLDKNLKSYFDNKESHLTITPLCIDNIESYLGSFNRLFEIEYSFSEKTLVRDFMTLKEINQSDSEVESYKVTAKLKRIGKTLPKQLNDMDKSRYRTFKVKGKSDENIQECIDLIEKSLTKSVKIKLTDDDFNNIETIRKILENETLKIFNDHIV